MTFQRAKRMVAVAGVVVAAGALPILVASPASATQSSCSNYVASHGFFAGPKVKAACNYGAIDTGIGKAASPACIVALAKLHVPAEVSGPACKRA
ncbi:hypothetical protein [Streptomyces sp. NPDC005485]|uniref:hypothetical protein n=1 Tax=Streptomyces sp. NPDC005485 TaxID=3155591 RepID=UPI0033AAB1CF